MKKELHPQQGQEEVETKPPDSADGGDGDATGGDGGSATSGGDGSATSGGDGSASGGGGGDATGADGSAASGADGVVPGGGGSVTGDGADGSAASGGGEGDGGIKKEVKVDYLPLDLASFQSTIECVRLFKDKNLPLHILINNAGIFAVPYSKCDYMGEVTILL